MGRGAAGMALGHHALAFDDVFLLECQVFPLWHHRPRKDRGSLAAVRRYPAARSCPQAPCAPHPRHCARQSPAWSLPVCVAAVEWTEQEKIQKSFLFCGQSDQYPGPPDNFDPLSEIERVARGDTFDDFFGTMTEPQATRP